MIPATSTESFLSPPSQKAKNPMPAKENFWNEADLISTYTRAQAIEDGVLVDLMQPETVGLVREAGFKFPLAMTSTCFNECVALTPAAERALNDVKGRLWDILWMLKLAIHAQGQAITIYFRVCIVRRRVRPTLTQFKAVCGPGDNGEPVITIMFPEED